MIQKSYKKARIFTFKIFDEYSDLITAVVFSRDTDIDNRSEISQILNAEHSAISFENQMHSPKVHIVENHGIPIGGDALITQQRNLPIAIRIADCAGIMLFDPQTKTIANIHAGWRGLANKVIEATIKTMQEKFAIEPQNIRAAISPMIGKCCSSFSNPTLELPKHMHKFIEKNNHVDLNATTEFQLKKCGVKFIENADVCTACDHDNKKLFWSHRRDPKCGRFGTAIVLK